MTVSLDDMRGFGSLIQLYQLATEEAPSRQASCVKKKPWLNQQNIAYNGVLLATRNGANKVYPRSCTRGRGWTNR